MDELLLNPGNQLILTVAVLVLYFLPTLIGALRGHHKMMWILLVNFFAGWTGAGWIFLLGYSCFSNKH
jgi:hypothetical protein